MERHCFSAVPVVAEPPHTAQPVRQPTSWAKTKVAPLVRSVLRASGQGLDAATRTLMEARFGHDFSRVRIHTDTPATESAQRLAARAYTVGEQIVFGAGQYAPSTAVGQQLLAHELTHVVQQQQGVPERGVLPEAEPAAEREAEAVASRSNPLAPTGTTPRQIGHYPPALARQQTATSPAVATPSGMTRDEFERTMKRRFLVNRIATGTMQEQASSLTPQGGAPSGGVQLPNWQAWDPGSASPVYGLIIESFENFADNIGGVPLTQEIIFYQTDYEVNQAGVGIPRPSTGASFGAGHLTIYQSLTTSNKALPVSRSNPQGNYPPVGIAITGVPGQTPGAPLPYPAREESTRRLISHELGHGLAEAAIAAAPATMDEYRREVGWTPGHPTALYDVGVPAVAQALAAGQPPPASQQITENNWNSPQWVEQPLSDYMVAGGPGEDFAEAVMTFIHAPNLLVARSIHRYNFLNSRKDRWLPQLLQLPRIGDFPLPQGDQRAA